jgi:N-acetylmuramoyl-L-alanine amidase
MVQLAVLFARLAAPLTPSRRVIALLFGVAAALAPRPTFADTAALAASARVAAETALSAHAPSVRVLAARLEGSRLHLDFSADLAAVATPGSLAFEALSRRVHVAVADTLRDRFDAFEIHTAIAGTPLDALLARPAAVLAAATPPVARQLSPVLPPPSPATAALLARRIAVSPGHGYYLNASNNWVLQRSFFQGIVEDFINHDLITELAGHLTAAGADVRPTRQLDRNAGRGESGFPQWQEAARYYIKSLGADPSVWNPPGLDHLSQDIGARPRYANSIGAEILVSLHNNGGGGTGTETLYDTNNGFGPASKRLADLVHGKLIAAIRRDYNPTWADRRVQGFNGNYGENRLATRPAILIELAFMDRPTPDNAALQDARFRTLAVEAIRDGIREFLESGGTSTPAAPSALRATGEPTGIALAWTDLSTDETGFRVERRPVAANAWTTIATLAANTTAYRDTSVSSGATYTYRLFGLNGTTASVVASNEATAAATATGLPALVVSATPESATAPAGSRVDLALAAADSGGQPVAGAEFELTHRLAAAPERLLAGADGRALFSLAVPAATAPGPLALTVRATRPGFTAAPALERTITIAPLPVRNGPPSLVLPPVGGIFAAGSTVTLHAAAAGTDPTYQWLRDGAAVPGATAASLVLANFSAAQTGDYAVRVSNALGSVTGPAAPVRLAPAAWLSNVSLRTTLAAGQTVIVGFVVSGGGRNLLVRAAGPALAAFGLAGAMADPRIELFRGTASVGTNQDWPAALAPAFGPVGAFAFPAASRDAAILPHVEGALTAQVTGTTAGTVLIEGYDTGVTPDVRLANLSARNHVGTGADLLIAGFFLGGTGTQRVLIRAAGPVLAALGVTGALADPKLEVFDGSARIAENDNWDAALAPVFSSAGAFPFPAGGRDAALVLTLAAGRAYTAQISGVNNATGEALVEVYALP